MSGQTGAAGAAGQGYNVSQPQGGMTVGTALKIASDGVSEINAVLADIEGGTSASGVNEGQANFLGDTALGSGTLTGADVLNEYGVHATASGIDISQASGAMVIDNLMQQISTKVQVAAQLLSTANNISKTAASILRQ